MIKSVICMLALVSVAAASEPSARQKCINDAASYLSTALIEAPVQRLVEVSRAIYPNIETMIEQDVPSRDYEEALLRLGPQQGCDKLEEHVMMLNDMVTCYNAQLEGDEEGLLDIARGDKSAKSVIEAYFACTFARGD